MKDDNMKDQDGKETDRKSFWIWLRRQMDDFHAPHDLMKFLWIILLPFIVIACISALLYLLFSVEEYTEKERLTSQFYIIILSFMILLYLIQVLVAIVFSFKEGSKKTIEIDRVHGDVEIRESVMYWTIRDFRSSGGPWILFIVAIFLPVMLSYIPHTMLILPENRIVEAGMTDVSVANFGTSALIYYICISIIAVLITVEASLLLSLRDIGGIWIAMLLASIIMDIISLFFLNSMGSPFEWITDKSYPAILGSTTLFMSLLAFICFISSFVIIIFARSSREMILEALVVEKSSDRKDEDTQKSDLS